MKSGTPGDCWIVIRDKVNPHIPCLGSFRMREQPCTKDPGDTHIRDVSPRPRANSHIIDFFLYLEQVYDVSEWTQHPGGNVIFTTAGEDGKF